MLDTSAANGSWDRDDPSPCLVGQSGPAAHAAAAAQGLEDAAVDAEEGPTFTAAAGQLPFAAAAGQPTPFEGSLRQPSQRGGRKRSQNHLRQQATAANWQFQPGAPTKGGEQLHFGQSDDAASSEGGVRQAQREVADPRSCQASLFPPPPPPHPLQHLQCHQQPQISPATAEARAVSAAGRSVNSSAASATESGGGDEDLMAAVLSAASLAQRTSNASAALVGEMETMGRSPAVSPEGISGGRRRAAVGLMTPNETKKQVPIQAYKES